MENVVTSENEERRDDAVIATQASSSTISTAKNITPISSLISSAELPKRPVKITTESQPVDLTVNNSTEQMTSAMPVVYASESESIRQVTARKKARKRLRISEANEDNNLTEWEQSKVNEFHNDQWLKFYLFEKGSEMVNQIRDKVIEQNQMYDDTMDNTDKYLNIYGIMCCEFCDVELIPSWAEHDCEIDFLPRYRYAKARRLELAQQDPDHIYPALQGEFSSYPDDIAKELFSKNVTDCEQVISENVWNISFFILRRFMSKLFDLKHE